MKSKYAGACLCGEVRYESDSEPAFSGNCHCKDCQRSSGGSFTPAMFFAEASVSISGAPKYFRSTGDSGRFIERGFCPSCRSQLFTKLEMMPGVLGIKAGTLDDASMFNPRLDFYVSSAQHWDHMDPRLPKSEKSPQG
ncbi:GFA family protein [Iodobacter sp. CM08]|uniref:GFA family protein n=1 Tax=Iodobacter sp. CM08 TaxID=3085902 RepID=UPI002981CFF1|nr:GFA family protein [Iodobacter sp. CM08]MDW5415259.1 GFA family protein [Iodobacter sp. CM08]